MGQFIGIASNGPLCYERLFDKEEWAIEWLEKEFPKMKDQVYKLVYQKENRWQEAANQN